VEAIKAPASSSSAAWTHAANCSDDYAAADDDDGQLNLWHANFGRIIARTGCAAEVDDIQNKDVAEWRN